MTEKQGAAKVLRSINLTKLCEERKIINLASSAFVKAAIITNHRNDFGL
ncbi:MAG: hypothetical protein IGS39_11380 [Calothrix sp. C42_A2020_038]|nr:hypothetical protein [Calothrix sp. C42_A2020_038]